MATLRLICKPSECKSGQRRPHWGDAGVQHAPGRRAFQAEGRPSAEAETRILGNSQEASVSAAHWAKRRKGEKKRERWQQARSSTADKVSLSELPRAWLPPLLSAPCTQREETTGHTSINNQSIDNLDIQPCVCVSHSVLSNSLQGVASRTDCGLGKDSLLGNWCWENWICTQKNEMESLPYTA